MERIHYNIYFFLIFGILFFSICNFGNRYDVSSEINDRTQKCQTDVKSAVNTQLKYYDSIGLPTPVTGQFTSPNGVAINSNGYIYVADYDEDHINVYSPEGCYIYSLGSTGSGEGQFEMPDDIVINGSDYLYVLDSGNSRIQIFDPYDQFVGSFTISPNYNSMAINSTGFVYITDRSNCNVHIYTAIGEEIGSWGSSGSAAGQFGSYLGNLAINSTGEVYVCDSDNYRVQIFSSTGTYLGNFREYGNMAGQFILPKVITIDQSDQIYVYDTYQYSIQKFASSGSFIGEFGSQGDGTGKFQSCGGIAINSTSYIVVLDPTQKMGQIFNPSLVFQKIFGLEYPMNEQFLLPQGIAVNSSGYVYIVDYQRNQIALYSPSYDFIRFIGGEGSTPGLFNQPVGIAINSTGCLYVTDAANNRIQILTAAGDYLWSFGTAGSDAGQFYYPQGVSLDSAGNIYVADTSNDRVQKYASDGTYLFQIGTGWGKGDTNLIGPKCVAINTTGYIYVPDPGNNRIKVFDPSGNFYKTIGSYGTTGGLFNQPTNICFNSNGDFYVTDVMNHRIQRFSAAGLYLSQIGGTYGTGNDQFQSLYGICVDPADKVYITDQSALIVKVFQEQPASTPPAPTWITTNQTTTSNPLTVSWNSQTDAESYVLYLNNSLLTNTTSTSYTYYFLENGTYEFTLTTKVYEQPSPISNVLSIIANVSALTPLAKPTWTTTNSTKSTTSVYIDWSSVSGATGYKLYLNGSYFQTTSTTSATTVILPGDSVYWFTVSTIQNNRESEQSNILQIIISGSGTIYYADSLGEFSILSNSPNPNWNGSVELSWGISSNADNYSLYFADFFITDINDSVDIFSEDMTNNSIKTSLSEGEYYFIVYAFNEVKNRSSNCLHLVIQFNPPGSFELSISTETTGKDTNGNFPLTWTHAYGVRNYTIYTYLNPIVEINSSVEQIIGGISLESYEILNKPNGTYYYLILATNENGNTISNCVKIIVEIPPAESGGNNPPASNPPPSNSSNSTGNENNSSTSTNFDFIEFFKANGIYVGVGVGIVVIGMLGIRKRKIGL